MSAVITDEQVKQIHAQLYGGFRGMGAADATGASKQGVAQADFNELKKRMNPEEWNALEEYRKSLMPKLRANQTLTDDEKAKLNQIYLVLQDDTLNAPNPTLDAALAASAAGAGADGGGSGAAGTGPAATGTAGSAASGAGGAGTSTAAAGAAGSGAAESATATQPPSDPKETDLQEYYNFVASLETKLNELRSQAVSQTDPRAAELDANLENTLKELVGQLKAPNSGDTKEQREKARVIEQGINTIMEMRKDLVAERSKERKDELALAQKEAKFLDTLHDLQVSWIRDGFKLQEQVEKTIATIAGARAKQAQAEAKEAKANLLTAETEAKIPFADMAGLTYAAKNEAELRRYDARGAAVTRREVRDVEREILREQRGLDRSMREFDPFGFTRGTTNSIATEHVRRRRASARRILVEDREFADSLADGRRDYYRRGRD